jgi:hypothetical protein
MFDPFGWLGDGPRLREYRDGVSRVAALHQLVAYSDPPSRWRRVWRRVREFWGYWSRSWD